MPLQFRRWGPVAASCTYALGRRLRRTAVVDANTGWARKAHVIAARFEGYEPNSDDEFDVNAVTLLRAAVAERSEAERHLLEAVRAARKSGMPWSAIGSLVGTSSEAARQRYGAKVA